LKNTIKLILLTFGLCVFVLFDIIGILLLVRKYNQLGSFADFNNWLISYGGVYKSSVYSKSVLLLIYSFSQIVIIVYFIKEISKIHID